MPPEDEPQPKAEDRLAVASWIESGLRRYVEANQKVEPVATTRSLTNFEYQNTMRDLFGFELKLSDKLPVDPVKPYRFNNTADFMLLGPRSSWTVTGSAPSGCWLVPLWRRENRRCIERRWTLIRSASRKRNSTRRSNSRRGE